MSGKHSNNNKNNSSEDPFVAWVTDNATVLCLIIIVLFIVAVIRTVIAMF